MIFDKKQNPDAPDLPAKQAAPHRGSLPTPPSQKGITTDPTLPQFFGNMAADVISNRREKLELFLQQCLG